MPASARHQDENGFLLVKGCPIASFGIFQYSAAQVGLDGDPNRIVNVFRPESEVNNADYLASFHVVPFINDHEMLSGFEGDQSAAAPEQKGVDGVLFDVGYKSPWVTGDIKIFSRSMQVDLNDGKKDLSLGYTCDFELKSGTWNGQDYEVIQINMRGNHIALVDVGRVPGARVLDGKRLCFDSLDFSVQLSHTQGAIMAKGKRTLDANVVATLKAQLQALLPTFEQFLSEEATEPAHQGGEAGGAAAGAEGATDPANAAGGTGEAAPAEGQGATGTGEAAAENATGATDPAAAEGEEDTTGGAAAGGEAGAEGGGDLAGMLDKLIQICTQLKGASGGAEGGAAGDEGAEGAEGTNAEEGAEDTVEGLEGTAREGTDEGGAGPALGEGGNGRASEGPAAGKHAGADAALRALHVDLAVKTRLVGRLSKLVGTFDGAFDIASATASDVAAYGVKKLKIKCAKGTETVALDAYLEGVEKARSTNAQQSTKRASDAAAEQAVPAIDAYFKE